MTAIPIRAGVATYNALVGAGVLETIGENAAQLFRGGRCAIVADENTAAFFAKTVMRSLTASGFTPFLITIPAGENSKSLQQLGLVCDEMEAAGLDRASLVFALGGGVVGDLAGFAAAIYRRGVRFVQVPTTLLAQVDSAIGGKTAVNTAAGKNLLGAFHQPALVLADTDTLRTLPPRELNQGFAEVIKHAIIADSILFDRLIDSGRSDLQTLVVRNIEIKAAIIARDARDTSGERALLNFGHTVGHAIERAAGYGELLHGEAVSLGLVAACDISVWRAGLAESEREKVASVLRQFGLPTKLPADFPRDRILSGVKSDKKFEHSEVRFVVTPELGRACLTSAVTLEDIERAIARL